MRSLMLITFMMVFILVGCEQDRISVSGDKNLNDKWQIVKSELHRLNPNWEGQYELETRITRDAMELKLDISNKEVSREDGVTTTQRHTANLSDISPLSKLKSLKKLVLAGTQVADITPLKNLKLAYLDISGTNVKDITPLRDMPLRKLYLSRTPVNDISVLSSLSELNRLLLDRTEVNSLMALKGKHLIFLDISGTPASNRPLPSDLEVKHLINK